MPVERGPETEKVRIQMVEKKVTMISKEMKAENIEEEEAENAKAMGTETGKETKKKVKEEDNIDTVFTGSGATLQ